MRAQFTEPVPDCAVVTGWNYPRGWPTIGGVVHDRYDYFIFIHMRDASHPERQFVKWVDPQIGRQRDAELCQAHAFGIGLDGRLSIEMEG